MLFTCKLCANALVSWTVSFLSIIFPAVKRKRVWTVTLYSRYQMLQSLENRIFNSRNRNTKPRVLITYVRLTRGKRSPRNRATQVREA